MQSSGGDPTISLGIQVPQAQGTGLNPLGTLNTWSEIQNRLNQNQLFQQTFQAKQRIGEIISAAPDIETGIQQVFKDPLAAAYGGAALNDIRNAQNTLVDMQGKQQTQAMTGLEATMHAISGSYGNPQLLPGMLAAQLKTLSPTALARVGPAANDLITSLTHGVDFSKPEGIAAYQKNLMGLMLASGMSPEVMRAASGVPAAGVSFQPNAQGQMVPVQTGGGVFSQPSQSVTPQNPLSVDIGAASGGGFAGPSSVNKSFLEHRGADVADHIKRLDNTVSGGYDLMQSLQEQRDALKDFKPGGGAGTYARIAQIAQAFGVPQEKVDLIAGGNLGAVQDFQKLAAQTAMSQLRQSLPQASHGTQGEFNVFLERNPNIETDKRAIEKIWNFYSRVYGRARDEQATFAEESQKPGFNIANWPATWQKIAEKKGYTGGIGIGAANTGTASETPTTTSNTLTRPPIDSFFK